VGEWLKAWDEFSLPSTEGWSGGLVLRLFLLGVGWSATFVAGSTLLIAAVLSVALGLRATWPRADISVR